MKKAFFILILSFIFFGIAFAETVLAKDYYYESIEVTLQVNKDSTFDVTEKQTYRLNGSFGYFYRDIALKDLDRISNIRVFNEKGEPLNEENYTVSYKNGEKSIKYTFNRKNFDNQLKSWTIKYKVHGGLGFYENYDEIYWNAVFADRDVIVKEAKVKVVLPPKIKQENIDAKMFLGVSGSKNQSSNYIINNNEAVFNAINLKPGEFLTIAVNWPKGFVTKPLIYRNQIINWIVLLLSIFLPLFVFGRNYKKWKKYGKDPEINRTIVAKYEPPEKMEPALVGLLVDQKFGVKEITATVIDLAVRGYLRIREGEKKFWGQKEYLFEKIKEPKNLKPFEEKIIKGIFTKKPDAKNFFLKLFKSTKNLEQKKKEDTKTVSSGDLKNRFYKEIKGIKKELHKELTQTGYVKENILKTRKKHQKKYLILGGILIFGFSFFIAGINILLGKFVFQGIIFLAGLMVSAVIGVIFGHFMPSLSKEGSNQKYHWLGFKEYLHTAERFRLEAETVETFSKYLPYAIVFEVEEEWARKFANLNYQEPNWYVDNAVYHGTDRVAATGSFTDIASSINAFSSSISSTLSSSPGGSGGGGSAGGGGGGGGGGAG